MALYVVSVPAPAAGHDWQMVVPGQYTWDVIAVAAQLNCKTTATVLVDSSGNGHNATVVGGADYSPNQAGPYGGGAKDFAYSCTGIVDINATPALGTTSVVAAFGPAKYSWDCWINMTGPLPNNHYGIFGTAPTYPSTTGEQWRVHKIDTTHWGLTYEQNAGVKWETATIAATGAWHHLAVTYDGVTWTIYLDGVSVATQAGPSPTTGNFLAAVFGDAANTTAFPGLLAGFAFYGATTLSAARVAAHAAASGSNAAYKAAVLADAPTALWMLDDSTPGDTRTVALDITDGTHLVTEVASGFAALVTAGVVNYSWQTKLASNQQTPDGGVTTVGIPDLILPGGYTIGTRTLDLAGTDQWSNINVWWSSGISDGTGGVDQFVYGDGAFLTYERIGSTP